MGRQKSLNSSFPGNHLNYVRGNVADTHRGGSRYEGRGLPFCSAMVDTGKDTFNGLSLTGYEQENPRLPFDPQLLLRGVLNYDSRSSARS